MGTRRRALGTRGRIMSHLAAAGEISDESGMASTLLAREVGYPGSSIAFAQLLSGMERSGLIQREVRGKRTYRITMAPGSGATLVRDGEHKSLSRVATTAAFDYDELARRLLVQVVRELAAARGELARLARPAQAGPGQDAGPPRHPARVLEDTLAVQPAGGVAGALPGGPDSTTGALAGGVGGVLGSGSQAGPGADGPGQPGGTAEGTLADLQRELATARALHSRVSAENARLREQLRAARRSLARLRGRAARRPVIEDLDPDETGLLAHLLAPGGDDPAPPVAR